LFEITEAVILETTFFLFDEDFVVMEAYRQGYLKNQPNNRVISRHQATEKLKIIFDTNGIRDTLPKKCLTATSRLVWFWNRTLSMEQAFAPNPLSSEELLINFENDISKTCELDRKVILEQPKWKRAFSSCVFRIQDEGAIPCNFVLKYENQTSSEFPSNYNIYGRAQVDSNTLLKSRNV
jgi:hypothetical protein